MSYRDVCYVYHIGRLQRTVIRNCIASAYLPNSPTAAFLPPNKVHEQPFSITDVACNAQNVARFFTANPAPTARERIEPVVAARAIKIGELLYAFAALNPEHLLPWHHVITMALDTCNVIMEVHAGTLAFGKLDEPSVMDHFRLQKWFPLKKQLLDIAAMTEKVDRWPRLLPNSAQVKPATLGGRCQELMGRC